MIIKEISADTFSEFANKHILKNFYQTKEYGELMKNSEYSVIYIGAYIRDTLVGGSLILSKTIGPSMKYGYAPRGFLIDYYDTDLLVTFTKKIKEFFIKKKYAFIKINPEITYSKIDFDAKSKTINTRNSELINRLKSIGYDKLKDNIYFESLLPKYTPVIYLPTYNLDALDITLINSVEDAELGGLRIITGNENDIEKFYSYIEHKDNKTNTYYKHFYETFSKSNMADLILLELNYETYIKYLQKQHIYETERNEQINNEFNANPNNTDVYNRKMKSDQKLAKISSEILRSNGKMQENSSREILGAAFVVKHQGRVTILIAGVEDNYEGADLKTFLFS